MTHYRVVIATGQTCQFLCFYCLPSSGVAYWLEQLLKYQLRVWVAPYYQLYCELPFLWY